MNVIGPKAESLSHEEISRKTIEIGVNRNNHKLPPKLQRITGIDLVPGLKACSREVSYQFGGND